jgi:hypothetical protein
LRASARIERLNQFWGGKMLPEVNARTCAAYGVAASEVVHGVIWKRFAPPSTNEVIIAVSHACPCRQRESRETVG